MTIETTFYKYLVNPVMRGLLKSPAHGLLSHNIGILHFTGRKSGRKLSTPLSYTREGNLVRLLSSQNTRWWHNFRDSNPEVGMEIAGEMHAGTARLLEGDSPELRDGVSAFLTALPRDAKVYGIKLDREKSPIEESLASAASRLILVEVSLTA
ncbi:MAG: nitroreductase/quinone reductase family protein [Halieaceae bacterium]